MTSAKQFIRLLAAAAIVSVALSSCSNKATEDQMKSLRSLDQQRDQLQQDIGRAQSTLRDAQGKLAAQERALADCQQQTQAVRAGLREWPNIWPDSAEWNPPAPPPPPVKKASHRRMRRHH